MISGCSNWTVYEEDTSKLAAKYPNIDKKLEHIGRTLLRRSKGKANADRTIPRFVEATREAVAILENPSKNSAKASSEAIALAYNASFNEELRGILEEVAKEGWISREQARLALSCLHVCYNPRYAILHPDPSAYDDLVLNPRSHAFASRTSASSGPAK